MVEGYPKLLLHSEKVVDRLHDAEKATHAGKIRILQEEVGATVEEHVKAWASRFPKRLVETRTYPDTDIYVDKLPISCYGEHLMPALKELFALLKWVEGLEEKYSAEGDSSLMPKLTYQHRLETS